MTDEINFEEELKKVTAERDAYANKLDEFVTENNKLKAELKVQQAVNRKTMGTSDDPPKDDLTPKKSVGDAFAEYREKVSKK